MACSQVRWHKRLLSALPDRSVPLAGDAMMTEHVVGRDSGPQLLPAFFNTDNDLAHR